MPRNDPTEMPSTTAQSVDEDLLNKSQSIVDTSTVWEFMIQTGQTCTTKIKLQLFPLNSTTRSILEKDGRNPFLELTLSVRKKISSVIKWTSDCCGVTAGELHRTLGSPTVFRLRYDWFSDLNVDASGVSCKSTAVDQRSESKNIGKDSNVFSRMTCDQIEKINVTSQEIRNPINMHEVQDAAMTEQMLPLLVGHVGDDRPGRSLVSWDDSLTNLSIGALLSEASLLNKINNPTQKSESKSNLQPVELISDISIGTLLTEASLLERINNPIQRSVNNSSLHPT
ncbi:hypothetical protein ACH5RR_012559 [Cinchona calisaya]|uniref:Uncharacterized protein n=1 Tax=Cinchona calisaya TaxID=153742 RepID=A0ABD3A9Q4_9GENT